MTSADLELLDLPARRRRRGPPLLFIHGAFHGAWCWADHFMPWFAGQGFDCFAMSYREHGGNPRTERHPDWRLQDYVDDAQSAIARLSARPVLVGHSLGGTIAQKVAEDGGFPGMVLLAPSPIGGSAGAALRMLMAHPLAMSRAMRTGDLAHALPAFLSFFLSPDVPAAERERIAARCDGRTSMQAANDAFYNDCPKPKRTSMPVLVVSGSRDWSIARRKNVGLARAYGGEHVVAPTAHDIMCDTQWQVAANQIEAWMSSRVGS
jgi:pimeloyl-ACP methyl ester carboxylesterase